LTALKPVKVAEPPKPTPQDISPKKSAEKKPEKKEPTREEILAQAMKEAKQMASKEKGSDRDALKQALGDIQKEVGSRGEPQGHPEGLGDQPTGAVVTYIEYLQIEIRKNWRYPVMSNRDWKATVVIGIDSAGTITNSRLTARSGREDFDASILRAVGQTRLNYPPPDGKREFEITFHHDDLIR
jgi:colicin import membrane protein